GRPRPRPAGRPVPAAARRGGCRAGPRRRSRRVLLSRGGDMTDPAGRPLLAVGGLDASLVDRVRRRLTVTAGTATPAAVMGAGRAEPAQAPLGDATLRHLTDRLYQEIVGAGPLHALLTDPEVTDVVVNGPTEIWVDRGAGMVRTGVA